MGRVTTEGLLQTCRSGKHFPNEERKRGANHEWTSKLRLSTLERLAESGISRRDLLVYLITTRHMSSGFGWVGHVKMHAFTNYSNTWIDKGIESLEEQGLIVQLRPGQINPKTGRPIPSCSYKDPLPPDPAGPELAITTGAIAGFNAGGNKRGKLTPKARLVLMVWNLLSGSGELPTNKRLAWLTRCSAGSVSRALRELERIDPRFSGRKCGPRKGKSGSDQKLPLISGSDQKLPLTEDNSRSHDIGKEIPMACQDTGKEIPMACQDTCKEILNAPVMGLALEKKSILGATSDQIRTEGTGTMREKILESRQVELVLIEFSREWKGRYGEECMGTRLNGRWYGIIRHGVVALGLQKMIDRVRNYLADGSPWLIAHRHPLLVLLNQLDRYGNAPKESIRKPDAMKEEIEARVQKLLQQERGR